MRSLPPLALPFALLACQSSNSSPDAGLETASPIRSALISEPMQLDGKAFDSADEVELPLQQPEEHGGLHNVFQLSETIVSGSEPEGDAGFESIRAMGVRTIVSVDGKTPDVEGAEAHGLRYVHVPIQYKGISDDELEKLAKTFRELDGPFYVHCFHGKHRGPAAAEVGRIVLDGVSRETAIAEMRQYCGTSSKYEGLYRVIATGHIPDAEESERYPFLFDAEHPLEGVAGLMVKVSRAHDHIEGLMELEWALDPENPDVDPLNEATILAQALDDACQLGEVEMSANADYRQWFATAREQSAKLVEELTRFKTGESAAGFEAAETFKSLQKTCGACHTVYRN